MKKTLLGTCGLIFTLLATGCGGNNPEDRAEKFVSLMTEADIQEAKTLASDTMKAEIIELENECIQPLRSKLNNDATSVLKRIYSSSNRGRSTQNLLMIGKVRDIARKIRKDMDKKLVVYDKKIQKDAISKYGSLKNVPKDKIKGLYSDIISKLANDIEDDVEEILTLLNVELDNRDDVKKIVASFMVTEKKLTYDNMIIIEDITSELLRAKNAPITIECVDKYTIYRKIEDISIVEVKENSIDRSTVRLEIIRKNGKSEKLTVEVEKFSDEWKIVSVD